MVFVTQVCHYIDSLVQCWGFAWSAYYIDQETMVQLAAGVGGYSPVSTCVYSSLLLYNKVRVAGLDDHAMSFIGPLKCEKHCPQRICRSKRCNSNMYRLSKSVTALEEQRFDFRHTKGTMRNYNKHCRMNKFGCTRKPTISVLREQRTRRNICHRKRWTIH